MSDVDRNHPRFKHGASPHRVRTRAYKAWASMRNRCNNPRAQTYASYGGRGIGICKEWDDFSMFLRDMGEPPDGMELDRINNDGDYEPSNCRWADRKTQVLNSSASKPITFNGETHSRQEWSRKLGLSPSAVSSRIRAGWPVEKVLTTPRSGNV